MMTPMQLRMARAALNWTVRELAARADINKNAVSRYESGQEILSSSVTSMERVLLEAGVQFFDEEGGIGIRIQRTQKPPKLKTKPKKGAQTRS
jgi:transcriptional regulator with XRE-family HTH domain